MPSKQRVAGSGLAVAVRRCANSRELSLRSLRLVHRLPPDSVWQAIAIGHANLPITAIGLAMGGNARTGMEDTLMVRRGVLATSNAELVSRLVQVAKSLERDIATTEEAARTLGLHWSPANV
jgi:uncharacterized protein (DUF849 family)